MMKQLRVVVDGKPTALVVEACGWDDGRTFCSNPRATLSFLRRRKKVLDCRLSEHELRWIDQLNSDPENQVGLFGVKASIRLQV